jgi:MbtH protein
MSDQSSTERYDVVMNHEEQYSIWPAGRQIPEGWSATGFSGTKEECLEHIKEVWTDMRPKSLRDRVAG